MNSPEPTTDRIHWQRLSACRSEDPDLFFPAQRTVTIFVQLARAKAICGRCPVTAECLHYALATGQEHGVWGGTSEEERKVMRRMLRAGSTPVRSGWLPAEAGRARTG